MKTGAQQQVTHLRAGREDVFKKASVTLTGNFWVLFGFCNHDEEQSNWTERSASHTYRTVSSKCEQVSKRVAAKQVY